MKCSYVGCKASPEYGKLYTYGRGGRTLAPSELIRTGGGSSFRAHEDCSERSIPDCMDIIRIVESFNRYVTAWCKSISQQWAEYVADQERERRREIARRAAKTRARNQAAARVQPEEFLIGDGFAQAV